MRALTPNDPEFFNQTVFPLIKAPDAWSTSTGNQNITIAIIDTGLDTAHPDLTANLIGGWNFLDNNSNVTTANARGTYTAGAAAAATNNGRGVAAVCWNCKVMPLKVSPSWTTPATDQAVSDALNYARTHGASIAVISYGMTGSPLTASAAQQFAAAGGLVVAAAGNEGTVLTTANDPNILTVTGTTSQDQLYSWSNSGPVVDMAAPGFSYTTAPGGGNATWWDSAVSAAYVAGVAALIKDANPACTGNQIATILKQSADDIGPTGTDASFGTGRLNALRAVGMAGTCASGGTDTTPPTVVINSPANNAAVNGVITVDATVTDAVGVTSVEFLVDNILYETKTAGPFQFSLNTSDLRNVAHNLTVKAYDAAGNSSLSTVRVTVANSVRTRETGIVFYQQAAGATSSQLSALQSKLTSYAAQQLGQLTQINVKKVSLQLSLTISEEQACQDLRNSGALAFCEVSYQYATSALNANDPNFSTQWPLFRHKIPDAWSTTTGSTGLIMAFIDTGIDGTHRDLSAKMVAGWNTVSNSADTTAANPHGTNLAGVAGAVTNNGIDMAGVCWGCKLMPVRVTNSTFGYAFLYDIVAGILWAADNGSRIINVGYPVTDYKSMWAAAQYAQGRNALTVAPAANTSTTNLSPDNPYVLTVSGFDFWDNLYTFSDTGNNIDVSAVGTSPAATSPGNGLAQVTGNSVAAAYASGIAALVMSANASLTSVQVANILQQTAIDKGTPGKDTSFGAGGLDAFAAVQAAGGSTTSPCDLNGDGSTNVIDVQQEVNQALGVAACTKDLNRDGACNVLDVQRVTNAALGGQCVAS